MLFSDTGAVSPHTAMSEEDLSYQAEDALLLEEYKSTEDGCVDGKTLSPI